MMRSSLIISLVFMTVYAGVAFAVDPSVKPSVPAYEPVDMTGSLVKVTFGLGIVVMAIFASAWAFRRMSRVGPVHGGGLRIIGGVNVGNRERVVLLQVGEQQLLIGVTAENVRTLHVLDQPIQIGADFKPPLENFSQKLNQAISQWKNRAP